MWVIVEALFFQYRSSFDNLNAINANPILFIQNVITNTNKNSSFWFLNLKINNFEIDYLHGYCAY